MGRTRPRRAPLDAETCTSHSKVQFQPSFSRAKCTSRQRSGLIAPGADGGAQPRWGAWDLWGVWGGLVMIQGRGPRSVLSQARTM